MKESNLIHPKKGQVQSQIRLLGTISSWLLNTSTDSYSTETCRNWSYSAGTWIRAGRQLSPIFFCCFTPLHFFLLPPSAELGLFNTISAIIFPSSWPPYLSPPSSCPGRIPPHCKHMLPQPCHLGTTALATSDWILQRPNQLPLTAATSLMKERRIKDC